MSREFDRQVAENIRQLGASAELQRLSTEWIAEVSRYKYSYNFTWMGRPIIQFPQDMIAMQEIIWRVKPEVIIETGVAHGGSLVFYASMLELIGGDSYVLGVDIKIHQHNRQAIEAHSMAKRIQIIEGSSVDERVARQVRVSAQGKRRVLVTLDSNHTHQHVSKELALYSPLVTNGSYLVVFDTIIEDLPEGYFTDRPWDRGNNPKTAVREFLRQTDRFEVDREVQSKLLISVAPDGYLKCVRD